MTKKIIKRTIIVLLSAWLIYIIYSLFSFWSYFYKYRNNWCIETSWWCNDECQDVIDECFKNNCKPWIECYCPNDCEYYKNSTWNFDVTLTTWSQDQDIFINNDEPYNKDSIEWKSNSNLEDDKSLKIDNIKDTKEEPVENNKTIRPKSQEDCPSWTKFQCPMWMCFNEETNESYPCQHTCFCTDPDMMF